MKQDHMNWLWIIAIGVLTLNVVIALWPGDRPSSAQEAKRFAYKVIDVPGDTQAMQAVLNEHGRAGWELVEVAIGDIQVPRLIFKK